MTNFNFAKIFRKTSARAFLINFAVFWTLFAGLFYASYRAAFVHLQANNPGEMQNRSELEVFYAPLTLRVGEEFSEQDLTDYFNQAGYDLSESQSAGSYSFNKNSVKFVSRSDAFASGEIVFEKKGVKQILIGGQKAGEIEIEPLLMRSFIKFINDESLREQRVRRTILNVDAIPETLADAVTSAEDARFFEHSGIDVFGIGYRLLTFRGGGSSITQQLLKNNVLKGSKEEFWQTYLGFLPETAQRKLMEIPFALAAEEMMSKDEILAAYLSMVPLGASEGVELQGVVSASQEYFGKPVSALSLSESATLAGMIHKPSFYIGLARKNDYEKLIGRRNRILDLMSRNYPEKYFAEIIEKAKNEPLKFVFASANRAERPADAYSRLFSAYVASHLPENLSEIRETEGRLQIFTTLDYRLQKSATEISEKAIADISKQIYTECIRQNPENIDCKSVKPQVSLVATEAETGEILAMYGGNSSEMNFALTRRSPASAIKPFYYLQAIESGVWNGKPFTPETIINPETDAVSFHPTKNIGEKSTATVGLAKSYNFHAVAAAESVGIEKAVEFVGKLTGSNPETSGMSAIGGSKNSETTLLDMISAYSIFANRGVFVKATPNKFYLQNGRKILFAKDAAKRIASVRSASETNEMMKLVLSEIGTAPNFKQSANLPENFEISAKTGSGMVADMWFFAVTPKIVVGVWVGLPRNEINLDMERGFTGGKIASPVAARFFRVLQKLKPNLLLSKK
ncbi:MAG TPA: transglycosylase domain-containing protein [Pyrinomonadaceae bacterium]|jgi:membrane peptidoglycan carboxypeptidase